MTFDALRIVNDAKHVAVRNFACGTKPGGGYWHGAGTQEEELCRQALGLQGSLYQAMEKGLYPIGFAYARLGTDTTRTLLIPRVVCRRDGRDRDFVMRHRERDNLCVISAAAPNLHHMSGPPEDIEIENSMRAIFNIPFFLPNAPDRLILGAWGCGAFGNDPERIASLFCKVLRD